MALLGGSVADAVARRGLRAAGAQAFDAFQTYVPNAYVYLHSRDLVGRYADGAPVNDWINRGSVVGNPANTGTARPTMRYAGVAGQPSVEFVAASLQALVSAISTIAQPLKFVVVAKLNAPTAAVRRAVGVGGNVARGIGQYNDVGTGRFGVSFASNYGTLASDANVHVFRGRANGASGAFFVDGVAAGGVGNAGASPLSYLSIGSGVDDLGAVSNFWDGHVCAIAIVPDATPDATLQRLERCWMVEFGAYNPLTAVAALHGSFLSDALWTPPAPGAPITSLRNQSGGGDPTQATASLRPLYMPYGSNGRPSARFINGAYLDVDIADIAGDVRVLTAFKSAGGANAVSERVMGFGFVSANGVGKTASDTFIGRRGANFGSNTVDTAMHTFRSAMKGVTSQSWLDAVSVGTGNIGTDVITRLTYGSGSSDTPTFSNKWTGDGSFWAIYDAAVVSDADLQNGPELYLRDFFATA